MDNAHQHHEHPHQVPDGATIPDGADVVALHPKFPPVPFEWLGLDTEGRSRLYEFGWTFWSTEPIGPSVYLGTLGEIRLAPEDSEYICAVRVDEDSRLSWVAPPCETAPTASGFTMPTSPTGPLPASCPTAMG